MLGDKVRGERATCNSKKSLGYANLLDLFKKEILCNPLLLQVEVHRHYSLLKRPAMLHGTQSGARRAPNGPLLGSGKTGTGKMPREASRPSLRTNVGSATALARYEISD